MHNGKRLESLSFSSSPFLVRVTKRTREREREWEGMNDTSLEAIVPSLLFIHVVWRGNNRTYLLRAPFTLDALPSRLVRPLLEFFCANKHVFTSFFEIHERRKSFVGLSFTGKKKKSSDICSSRVTFVRLDSFSSSFSLSSLRLPS